MRVEFLIEPDRGDPDQIGLHVNCPQPAGLDALERALRRRWRISRPLPSFYRGQYTNYFYITADAQEVRAAWPEIEAALEKLPASHRPSGVDGARPSAVAAVRPSPSHVSYEEWNRRFKATLAELRRDVEQRPLSTGRLSVQGVDRLLLIDQQSYAEEDLLRTLRQGEITALRPLVHLYYAQGQHDEVVSLYETHDEQFLALPASRALTRELISSHVAVSELLKDQRLAERARSIARDMLPELERLRQADGIRELLTPAASAPEEEQLSLSEELRSLIDLLPEERIPRLERLVDEHSQAHDARLALADALAAVGREGDALRVYQRVPPGVPEHEEAQRRAADMLLRQRRYHEVVSLLEHGELSPRLGGRLGAAYFALSRRDQARHLLESAWAAGARSPLLMQPLAQLLFQANEYERAAEVYQMLDHDAPGVLTARDYYTLSELADIGLLGYLPPADVLPYYDRCVERAPGSDLTSPELTRVIRQRADAARRAELSERILDTHADWLELLAESEGQEQIAEALDVIKELRDRGLLTTAHHFELLEALEGASDRPDIRALLVGAYQSIALSEIDDALRQTRPEEPFFRDLLRAIFHLSQSTHDDIVGYRAGRREETARANVPVAPEPEEQAIRLEGLRIALVGGHEKTRREVSRELVERYSALEPVEVAPSHEAHFSQSSVRAKIQSCHLVAVIIRSMGHDLSGIVGQLETASALSGEVLWVRARGRSGVVREIVARARSMTLSDAAT